MISCSLNILKNLPDIQIRRPLPKESQLLVLRYARDSLWIS